VHESCTLFFHRKLSMVYSQIDRLKKDTNELEIYAKKLEKKGLHERAKKILKKKDFILQRLENVPSTG